MKSVSFTLIAFILPTLAQPIQPSLYPNQYPKQYSNQYANQYSSPALNTAYSPAGSANDVSDRMFYFPWFWVRSYSDDDDRSNIKAAALKDQSTSNIPASEQKISLASTQPKAFQSDSRDFGVEQSPIQPNGQTDQCNLDDFYTSQSSDSTFLPSNNEQENWAIDPPKVFGVSGNQDSIDTPDIGFESAPDTDSSVQLPQPSSPDPQSNVSQQAPQIEADSPPSSFGIQGTGAGDDSFLNGPKNPVPFLRNDKKSDTCNMRSYRFLIGSNYIKKYNYFTTYQFKFNQNILPQGSRILGPNTPVTMDLRPSRLNVIYKEDPRTKQNKVVKLECY
ncbi:hypothetical protein CONCODRAFT_68698 [Conidiobolus coronatus NRRL 28638]|uniref:Uncharacterized protein n=1 Tax=Conidiobolus coronatus (strain ATCC 28846 / CBS 209.66 / NRRL 28638) TaxID=796925 RepID=A0A137PCY4_CONC2|nr:hypothetical protein CONCODRAFT_68698 [Conidiobolus coronatus NRRL 28638]|eukprot:KXN72853.1 hypothetical protein CONCODRAFT_68698 [Conidiobolus coronatus NRRL 28638]